VYAVFVLLKNANVLSLSGTMMNAGGLGTIFIVGLVAASSTCLAVVGGLLLSVSAAWAVIKIIFPTREVIAFVTQDIIFSTSKIAETTKISSLSNVTKRKEGASAIGKSNTAPSFFTSAGASEITTL
jgi:mannitol-specific phosphotransferase system IIBC component